MEITLTPEIETMISEEMQTGNYFSPNDVLLKSLLLLKAHKIPSEIRRENLRHEIQKGIDAIRSGNSRTYGSANEMIEDVIKEARDEFEAKNKNGK